ncbi:MAG: hypothetical protein EOQ47_21050 [Mesorhizobium sp.]|nr:MAG: hypothetical protein EOQ47_21050 [Mesorhizobium sp.]
MAAHYRPQLFRTWTQKNAANEEKMAESAAKRHRDDGIMTFVLGAMRKRSVALDGSSLADRRSTPSLFHTTPDGRLRQSRRAQLLRTFPGIACFLSRNSGWKATAKSPSPTAAHFSWNCSRLAALRAG